MQNAQPEAAAAQGSPVGWIGTGVMGAAMCAHLIGAGHPATIHTRTASKARALLDRGARWAATPREAACGARAVFTMVGHPEDVRAVYFGPDGVIAGAEPGALLVDMTTTEPTLAREIHAEAARRGVRALDAPVSGGDVGARHATLSVMVGGDEADVLAAMPLLRLLGKTVVRQGGPGAGQHAKMCNQIVIAGTMLGVCESLVYARRAGLDPSVVLESIAGGAAGCWTLANLAPRMLRGDFAPGFMIEHFVKDLGIALRECEAMRLTLPGLELARRLYRRACDLGHARKGTHALLLALDEEC